MWCLGIVIPPVDRAQCGRCLRSANVPVQRRQYAVRWNRLLADRLAPHYQKPSRTLTLRSGDVEAIKVHHFVPGRDEVMDKFLPRVGTSVDFSQGAELGVRTKDQVDARPGPLRFASFAIAAFDYVCILRVRIPLSVYV